MMSLKRYGTNCGTMLAFIPRGVFRIAKTTALGLDDFMGRLNLS
jgi:hypothetical protein